MNDTVAAASPDLFHAHVPFDEPPDLPFGIACCTIRATKSSCFFSVSPSFFVPNEITGNRSSTCENIRFSMTSRIFSYEVQPGFLPPVLGP